VPTSPIAPAQRAHHLACQTFDIEAQALLGLKKRLTASFAAAVQTMLACKGRVVVMGMGKSGHVGRKIAATLASTGTPSMFVHPAEASHGDLGMVTPHDIVLAISNSGQSDEITAIIPALKRLHNSGVDQEACPLNLAPTASTTAQMAMGDALAVALLDARGFQAEDFARSHPGGSLGRKLLTHVRDVMRTGEHIPQVAPHTPLIAMVQEMSRKGLGATAVTSETKRVLGIFTDGDLRRLIETGQDIRSLTAQEVMHAQPHLVQSTALAVDAVSLMEQHRITSILVIDEHQHLVGALNSNDLMRAKVI
jgi:arabinose-5-phosphate isomerase